MSSNGSVKSIIYALVANFGIAIIKTTAAIITGSGSMLAESIHSYADCGNQGLLFIGLKRAKKPSTVEHPLGYGKEIYFWSFIVALILFSMGGLFSIYEGFHKLHAVENTISNPFLAIGVLIVSIILECFSLLGCVREIKKIKGKKSLLKWLQQSRQSELVVVFGEDVAAVFGLFFALIAILLTIITGNPVFDAIGSIFIGVLLVFVSIFIGVKIKGLLIGKSVEPENREKIENLIINSPEVVELYNLITFQLGDQIMVAVKARMKHTESAKEMIENINICEKRIKDLLPQIQWIFFEPDIKD